MAQGDTPLHVIGNLTSAPELRFTPQGVAQARFTVASTPRFFDKQTSQWRDGDALFMRCTAWRQLAENVAELAQGTRVVVSGRLRQRSYEHEGQKRSVLELEADEVGASLKFATVKVAKVSRSSGDTSGGSDDPWTQPAQAATDDEVPF